MKIIDKLKAKTVKDTNSDNKLLNNEAELQASAKPEAKKRGYIIDTKGVLARCALYLMAQSVVFRLIGSIGNPPDRLFAVTQLLLPLLSAVLFSLVLVLFGRKSIKATILPVALGIVFFIFRICSMADSLPLYHVVLCTILYVLIFVLWTTTAAGVLFTKWLLIPVFALPFLYHVLVEDYTALKSGLVSFSEGMQEMSVLCIMLSMLCVSVGLKKKTTAVFEQELPAIKDPIIRVNPANYDDQTASAEDNSEKSESEAESKE